MGSAVRTRHSAPVRGRHYSTVAQRIAEGSQICASRLTVTQGFLIIGLELSLQADTGNVNKTRRKNHLLLDVNMLKHVVPLRGCGDKGISHTWAYRQIRLEPPAFHAGVCGFEPRYAHHYPAERSGDETRGRYGTACGATSRWLAVYE